MNYEVLISAATQAEMDEAFDWLVAQSPQHGPLWYDDMIDEILSLAVMPTRCPIARESSDSPEEIRQLLVGNKRHAYRVLFTIRDTNVMVLHVRHAARS
jgi:plasmid stabilization system protein ParE